MKSILSFIHKEFLHIFRDPRTMLIVLAMPIVQILLFGFAISTEVRDATVDIVGDPYDASIRDILPKIEHNTSLSFGRFLDSPEQAEERLRKGESKAVVIFENQYDRSRYWSRRLSQYHLRRLGPEYGSDGRELCEIHHDGCAVQHRVQPDSQVSL